MTLTGVPIAEVLMSTSTRSVTADDLLRMPNDGGRYELVEGELISMAPAGGRHGHVAMQIGWRLAEYADRNGLGMAFAAETGFLLARDPDTVRAPDAAFIAAERLPPGGITSHFVDIVPDLVVEVASPGDSSPGLQAKTQEWLSYGVRMVWVADPNARSIAVYRSGEDVRILNIGDEIEGGPLLPGFRCPVKDIL